ncbi:MAG: hypothetical protein Q9195_009211 [Heterodermia aff. obscurata]
MTEIPLCWIERPSLFAAPALEPDPARRALLFLKWFIVSLKAQFYVGEDSKIGMQKPLNPFLGELFLGSCTDEAATTRLVVEQVRYVCVFDMFRGRFRFRNALSTILLLLNAPPSHHPPVAACYFWDDEHGIQCEGFSRVEMTFNGNINIKLTGQSFVHIDKYDEMYRIPMLDAKVVGFFSGHLYPELCGKYRIPCSSGYISEIDFCGKGFLSGERNHFDARVFREESGPGSPLYTLSGQWSGKFQVHDCGIDAGVETCDINSLTPYSIKLSPEAEQDPWETRRAWRKVHESLAKGDMQATVREKSKIEVAQRAMRRHEANDNVNWQPVFFSKSSNQDIRMQALEGSDLHDLKSEKLDGVWKVDRELARRHKKPFHGGLTPGGANES